MQFSAGKKWQRNGVTNWKLELFEYVRSSPFQIPGVILSLKIAVQVQVKEVSICSSKMVKVNIKEE
jgi:hypothetical protein